MVTTAITGGPGGATSSAKQVYSLTGDNLTLEASNSLPDGSMSQVRTATYVEVHAGADAGSAERAPAESGYTSLFNGKDLTGWKASANPDSFKVENGAIIANAAGQASHLFYDGPVGNHAFTNFDLRLDVLARYRSNGGVYVMTEFQPQGFPGEGLRDPGQQQPQRSHPYRQPLPHRRSVEHPGERRRVDTDGDQGSGEHDHDHGEGAGGRPLDAAGRLARQLRHASRKIAPGTIAFQSHDTYSVTAYSNIRIKLLN